MNIKNKKLLKRVLEVSICSGLILTTFSGCSNALEKQMLEQVQEDDDSLIPYEDLITYKYYIICIDDSSYKENVYITRLPSLVSISHLGNMRYEYYYSAVSFDEQDLQIMGSVYYNRENKKIASRTGSEILYAISLVDYLESYDIKKESFSKVEMMAIYNQAKEDYTNNDFKKLDKKKVLIKENK